MKVQRLLAAVLIAALLLTGCTSLSLDESDILSPPKASGSRAEIQKLIEKDAKGVYQLIYPSSGAFKNGIIRYDVDTDGDEDAIALYTTSDGTPRLLLANNISSSFQSAGSISLHSANITELRFADINADEKEELIICFDAGSSSSVIEAYLFGDEIAKAKAGEGFRDYLVADFTGNSAAEILVTDYDENAPAKARLMAFADGSFHEDSSCDIDAEVLSFINLRFDSISEEIGGAVADGKLAGGEYSTQLFYYDSAAHMLVNPLFMNASYSESIRTPAVTSTDIDEDGMVEVPICLPMASAKDEDPDTVCSLVRWSGYVPELMALSTKTEAVLCDRLGFSLQLDADTLSGVTARYTGDNTVTLYKLTYKGSEPIVGKALFTISRYEKNSFDPDSTEETVLRETYGYTYTYSIAEGSPFTLDTINNSFKLLEADQKQ